MTTHLKEIDLDSLKEQLRHADKELFEIIQNLPLKKAHRVFEATYSYGTYLTQNGIFKFPEDIEFSGSLDDIYKELSYRSVPLGIVMKNGFEVVREQAGNIIPIAIRKTGLHMGVWETYALADGSSAIAGSRVLFFLPKIADSLQHKRLKKYGVKRHAPHSYFDQWKIFTEMTSHPDFPEPWQHVICYLGKQWFIDIMGNKKWHDLKIYLLEKVLEHSVANRSQVSLDAIWNNFRNNLAANHYKVNPELLETLKYLMMIANGDLPGFKVANSKTDLFPYTGIIKTYTQEYGLNEYAPTMMYADYFNIEKDPSIYYSLQVPLCSQTPQKNRNSTTTRTNLFDLIELTDLLLQDISAGRLGKFGQFYYDLFSQLEFEFFHSDPDENKGVYASHDMPQEDNSLIFNPFGSSQEFAHHSSFIRGCIRISKK